jgi:MFS family permease
MKPTADSARPVRLVLQMCGAEILTMMGAFAFPALLPLLAGEWGLSQTQAGWINGAYFAGYTLGVPLLATLTDRIDGRWIYLGGAAVGAAASAGFAAWAEGFRSALLLRALGGLGLAGTFLPGLKALVDRVGPQHQPRAVAYYTATFGLGTSLSFFAAGELGRVAGWRPAFAVASACALAALLLAAALPAHRTSPPAVRRALLDFRPVLRNRRAVSYILAYAAHTWELFAFRSWVVAFLAFSLSLDPGGDRGWAPASVAALAALAASGANMAGGELSLRLGRRRVLVTVMLGSALFGSALGFAAALPYPWVALLCALYGLLVQADSSALHMETVMSAPAEERGTTMALQSLVGFSAAFAAPLAVGVVLDLTGGGTSSLSWGAAFVVMAGVVALGPLFLRSAGRPFPGHAGGGATKLSSGP